MLFRNTSSGSTFYTFDEQGNTAQRLDSSQNILTSHIYDSFGYGAQWGYYTDQETGLVLCTNRYYDPGQGRWITRDPIGFDGGINLYGYVTNNPMNEADPSGFEPFLLPPSPAWLPYGWKHIPEHRAPFAPRYEAPSGKEGLEFGGAKPDATGRWGSKPHWHKLVRNPDGGWDKEKKHYRPGTFVDLQPCDVYNHPSTNPSLFPPLPPVIPSNPGFFPLSPPIGGNGGAIPPIQPFDNRGWEPQTPLFDDSLPSGNTVFPVGPTIPWWELAGG